MSRTRILVWVLVLVVLIQLFPDRAGRIELLALIGAAAYVAVWAGSRHLAQRRRRRAAAAQEAADDAEYRLYKSELDSIRRRYETSRDPDDYTAIPEGCKRELNELHDRHQDMLARRFGTSVKSETPPAP